MRVQEAPAIPKNRYSHVRMDFTAIENCQSSGFRYSNVYMCIVAALKNCFTYRIVERVCVYTCVCVYRTTRTLLADESRRIGTGTGLFSELGLEP